VVGYYVDEPELIGAIGVPFGVAVIHEFGHAFRHFHNNVPSYPDLFGLDTNAKAIEEENKARVWYARRRNGIALQRIDHYENAKYYHPLDLLRNPDPNMILLPKGGRFEGGPLAAAPIRK
jgi:hypothetical protein